jgi:hypothetical protein
MTEPIPTYPDLAGKVTVDIGRVTYASWIREEANLSTNAGTHSGTFDDGPIAVQS